MRCEPSIEPRLGAGVLSQRTSTGVEVFGVVSTDGTAAGLRPVQTRVGSWSSNFEGPEHLWLVGSTVKERFLWAAAPVGPLALDAVDPVRRSAMRLRITTSDAAGGSVFEFDLGQSLELVTGTLQVELWAPEGSVALAGDSAEPRQGLLFRSHCDVKMLKLEASRGQTCALLTQTVPIPGGQAHVQRVPARARRLTAYASSLPGQPVWRWLRGDPTTTAVPLGTVAWSADRPRTEVDVPSATHLRIEPDPAARVFTLVWTICP